MDRDTLIFIAFCVFILYWGYGFGSSSGSGRKERRQIGVLQMKRPLAGEKPEALLYSDSGDCVRRFTDLYAFLVNP